MEELRGTGKFIVLDGNDGSGKATQAKLLYEHLEKLGIPCEKIDFPRYGANFFGALLAECLAGKHGDFVSLDPKIASSLYALDRLESSKYIRDAIADGKVIIADRFSSSNQIHQGGKIADLVERKMFLLWLENMEHNVLNIPQPDAVIYLKVPIEKSIELLLARQSEQTGEVHKGTQDTVEASKVYLEQSFNTANWLASHQPNWHVIECVEKGEVGSREHIHDLVVEAVLKVINNSK